MSVAAEQERSRRAVWAAPGGFHDGLVSLLKIVLPILVGILAAFLAAAPLTKRNEVSFVLDKGKVAVASERMRVTEALYRGQDSKGEAFSLHAGSAIQKTSRIPIVEMKDLSARLQMQDGPALLSADRGRYNMNTQNVMVDGPVLLHGSGGYKMTTRDVNIDLPARSMASQGSVDGTMPIGTFSADHLAADLDARTAVLTGRVHLLIRQNGRKGR